MAYDSDSRLFHEYMPSLAARRAEQDRSVRTGRTWRQLSTATRLQAVEKALAKPANDDLPDGFPVAL